jgi:hypothetical protein
MATSKIEEAKGSYGKCLICQLKGTDEDPTKRGLCVNHYARFYRWIQKIGKDTPEARAFERKLENASKLLPSRQGQRAEDEDPFAEDAVEFLPESRDMRDLELATKRLEKLKAKKNRPAPPAEKVPDPKPEQTKGRK